MIELEDGPAACCIDEREGGRLAMLVVHGRSLLVGREGHDESMRWGSYPMVPWAGRIRDGRFRFDGVEYAMPRNLAPHAIHGLGYTRPWEQVEVTGAPERSATIRLDLADPWPFGGTVTQGVRLLADGLECTITVGAGDVAMPAQVGWHPWFVKPDHAQLRFAGMYVRGDDGIPTGEIVSPPLGPWDDCFVDPAAPIELRFGDLVVTITSDCTHWVIYDEPAHATCVEPQSGPPNGLSAAHVLQPHETLTRIMRISWALHSPSSKPSQ